MSEIPPLESSDPNAEPVAQQPPQKPPGDLHTPDAVRSGETARAAEPGAPPPTTADDPPYILHDRTPAETTGGNGAATPPLPLGFGDRTRPPDADLRLRVDHVPSVGHCYPGESVVLHTRVRIMAPLPSLVLWVEVPRWLRIVGIVAPPALGVHALQVMGEREDLRWEVPGPLESGAQFEVQTTLLVPNSDHLHTAMRREEEMDQEIVSLAHAVAAGAEEGGARSGAPVEATAVVALRNKGAYLRHLPAVYERDSFMSRFLMLFESFWAPINGQIDSIANYFDPMIAPVPMVRWLADRLDLALDDDLPEETLRRLVARAVPLYRRRGTRTGLEELLETYTGGQVKIVERRANNLKLGAGARLGAGVALGTANQPHTFTVQIRLEPIPDDPAAPGAAVETRARRRERIRALIDLEKPAHVTYTLDVDEDEAVAA